MANADQHPQAHPSGAPHINPVHQSPHLSFWIREMPFSLVLDTDDRRRCLYKFFENIQS